MWERTIVVNGVSKAYAMTGWRIGFLAAPKWIVSACNMLQGQYTSGPCSVSQKAAEAAWNGPQDCVEEMRLAFKRRRNLLVGLLREIPGLEVALPEGAFYLFPKCSSFFGKTDGTRVIKTSTDLAMYLLEVGHVATVGGDAFGAPDYFRLSYATSEENIKEGIGIVGLGLIGGSLAVDLRARGYASRFIGTDKNPLNAEAAGRLGLVDRVVPLEECIDESDIIVVSVPVSAAAGIIHTVLDTFKDKGYTDKIVMDVCSTKSQIAERLKYHPCRKRYVATHPMAGTEHSGPWAALPGLFDARACIIADQDESDPAAVRTVEELYKVLNMRIVYMTSDSHDVPLPRHLLLPGPDGPGQGARREAHLRPGLRRLFLHRPPGEVQRRHVGSHLHAEPGQSPARDRRLHGIVWQKHWISSPSVNGDSSRSRGRW